MQPRSKSAPKKPKRPIPIIHLEKKDEKFKVLGTNTWQSYWREPYYLLLTAPLSGYFLLIVLSYVTLNCLFTLAYLAGGDCIANARPGSFQDVFFFSVQTFASIGYGTMYPNTLYANTIVTIEAIIGLMAIALLTGLGFARFSRPTARVVFSKIALITAHNGKATLMFRAANLRHNQIVQAEMQAYLLRDEITDEGISMRRIHDLKLVRSQTPNFMLTWTAMHQIDQFSPLYGINSEGIKQTNTTLTIVLSGIDETVANRVHARHEYSHQEILWNKQFVDVFYHSEDGHRYIDYNHFHDVVSMDQKK